MKVNFKSLILLVVIIVGMILAVSLFSMNDEEKDAFLYNEVVDVFNEKSDLIYSIHIDQYNVLHLGLLQPDGVDENGDVKYKVNSKGELDLLTESFDITSQKTLDFIYEKLHSGELANINEFVEDPDYQTPWYILYLPYIILGVVMNEGYLADIALIYAMISFLAVVVLTKVYTGVYLEQKEKKNKKQKEVK